MGRSFWAGWLILVPLTLLAQDRALPVPPNVAADGVPAIPMKIVAAVAPYGQFLVGAAMDGIKTAYQNGAVILVEGQSSMVFGAWVVLHTHGLKDGFEWLPSALIGPGVNSAASPMPMQTRNC